MTNSSVKRVYQFALLQDNENDAPREPAARLNAIPKRKSVTYSQLVAKLEAIGISEKEVNVRNKLSRGKFSAAFLLQCLQAIEVTDLRF